MTDPRTNRWLPLALCAIWLAACGDTGGGEDDDRTPDAGAFDAGARDVGADAAPDAASPDADDECVDNQAFFDQQLWPDLLSPVCGACHTPQGAARDSNLVFVSSAVPTFLRDNYAIVDDVSRLERDGTSLLLLKPSAQIEHGGGEVAPVGSDAYALLEAFLERRDAPVVCEDTGGPTGEDGLVLLDNAATLRKAALHLTGT